MLAVRNINAYYGDAHILHGVSLSIERNAVVTL